MKNYFCESMKKINDSSDFKNLNKKIYEFSFFIDQINLTSENLTLKLQNHDTSDSSTYELQIKPPPKKCEWRVPQEEFIRFLTERTPCVITNFQMVRSYVTDLRYTIIFEGWPQWKFVLKFAKNITPQLSLSSIAQSNSDTS